MARYLRCLSLLLLLPALLRAQAVYANNGCVAQGGGGSISCTTASVTAGQTAFIFAFDTYNAAGPGPSALADTGSYAAIASITGPTHPPNGGNWENLWVATNLGAGSHTFTASTPGPGNGSGIEVVIVSGAANDNPVDQYGVGYQNDNYACTASAAAASPNELALEFDDGVGPSAPSITASPTLASTALAAYANGNPNSYFGAVANTGTVTATSNYGYNGFSACVMLTVVAAPPPCPTAKPLTTTTTNLPASSESVAYSTLLHAAGGTLPFTWTLASGMLPAGLSLSGNGTLSGTPLVQGVFPGLVFAVEDAAGSTAATPALTLTIAYPPISISSVSCPAGTQYQSYAGCTLAATGGEPPYTWSAVSAGTLSSYDVLPEGLSLSASGVVSGSYLLGMGTYNTGVTVTDAQGSTATAGVSFAVNAATSFLSGPLFPSDSIWTQNVSALPVDTSPAAAALPNVHLQAVFGPNVDDGGYPVIAVPATQPLVSTAIAPNGGPSMFATGPWPQNAPIEGPTNCEQMGGASDCHSFVVQLNASGAPSAGFEMYQATELSATSWQSTSQGTYTFAGYGLYPQDNGYGVNAAGLPIIPFLPTVEQVAAGGGVGPLLGTIDGNNMLARHVWPATGQAGGGSCSGGYEDSNKLISQINPPTSCSSTRVPFGELYRITAAVYANPPSCFTDGNHPQSAALLKRLRNYGFIAADQGSSSFIGILGPNDARWNTADLSCLNTITGDDFEPVEVEQLAKDWPGTSTDYPAQGTSQIITPASTSSSGGSGSGGSSPTPTPVSGTGVETPPAGATYYMSPSGNDTNSGTSSASPWLTPNHPGLNCGDTILAAPGNYAPQTLTANPTCSGHGAVDLRCVTFAACTVNQYTWNQAGILFQASNWEVFGWEVSVVGGPYTGCFDAQPAGNASLHDIYAINNVANGCEGGGFAISDNGVASVDYLALIADIAWNSAQGSMYCFSGFSVLSPAMYDSQPGTHIFLAQDFAWHNVEPPQCAGVNSTDGHGFILDTFSGNGTIPPYTQQAVIEDSLAIYNGAFGIFEGGSGNSGAPIAIRNNTAFGNFINTNQNQANCGQLGSIGWAPTNPSNINRDTMFTANLAAPSGATEPGCGSNPAYAYFFGNVDSSTTFAGNAGSTSTLYGTTGNIAGFLPGLNMAGVDPQFPNPVEPPAPSCSGTASVIACMANVIAGFTSANPALAGVGYQAPSLTPVKDPLFPQWLCGGGVYLPPGLVTMGCNAAIGTAQ